jgi:putative oxidoreductase
MSTFDLGILLLSAGTGLTFAAHGAQKVFGWWGGPGMVGWQGAVASMGFRPAPLFAYVSAYVELIGGLLLAVGLFTPVAAAALVAQSVVIVFQAHWSKGFFNRNGGIEFGMILGIAAATVALTGPAAVSLDAMLGIGFPSSTRVGLVLLGLVAGSIALAVPRFAAHPPRLHHPRPH